MKKQNKIYKKKKRRINFKSKLWIDLVLVLIATGVMWLVDAPYIIPIAIYAGLMILYAIGVLITEIWKRYLKHKFRGWISKK